MNPTSTVSAAHVSHALVRSPHGRILMRSVGEHLAGLYFVGQKDCPDVAGFPSIRPERFDPGQGVRAGRFIRGFKALRHGADSNGELNFDSPSETAQTPKAVADADFLDGAPWLQYHAAIEHDDGLVFLQTGTPARSKALLRRARDELFEYFNRRRQVFDVPLAPAGTAFQRKIWEALLKIPYGELVAYGDVACMAGMSASHGRAVGAAVGRNPVSIIIPCHRVVSKAGMLTGYSGGLDRKLALLELEGFTVG